MKKLILILSLLLAFSFSGYTKGYKSSKKHHTVKRMTKRQVKNASKGKTFYRMKKNGKIKKRKF